jgi:tetratricopeptide (TPR) repeat protein
MGLLCSCSSPEKDKVEYYQSALEHIEKKDPEAAILQLLSVLQIDAKYGPAYYQLGLLYLEKKEPKKAFDALLRAADLEPDNLDASLRVAQFYLYNRQKEESRQRIDHILSKEPNNRSALILLANLELVEGRYAESMAALGKIGGDLETSSELQNIKGRIFAAQENWELAEEAFLKAVSLGKDDLSNYMTLLLLYQKNQEKEKTKKLLDDMIVEFPENPQVHQLLANFYQSVGDKKLFVEELQKIIEMAPANPRFRLQLAEYYRENNQDADAEKALTEGISTIESDADLTAALATLYFDQMKFEETKALLETLENKSKGHGGAKLLEARFLMKDGKTREGITLLQELNKDFPDWGEPYFYLGLAYYSLGDVDLAQNAVASAIQKYGKSAKYHTLMAQIFQVQGEFENAQEEAVSALRLNPKNIRSALILSRALVDLKRYDQAISLLTNMNSQVTGNVEILGNLALAYFGVGQKEEGEKTLISLLDSHPGNVKAVSLLLDSKYKNDYAAAEMFIQQQIEQSPTNDKLYLLLGDIFSRQSKFGDAFNAYKKAQSLVPEDINAFFAEVKLLRQLDKNTEAMELYQLILQKQPRSLLAHMGIADLLQAKGETAEAEVHYKEVLKIEENYAPAANNLAWLIASDPAGDLGEALMLAMRAKQVSPASPVIADTLGWVHYKRQSYSLAITQFELALKGLPENPTMAYHLALAFVGNNEKEKAIKTLEPLMDGKREFAERIDAEKLLAELKKG